MRQKRSQGRLLLSIDGMSKYSVKRLSLIELPPTSAVESEGKNTYLLSHRSIFLHHTLN